MDEGNYLFNIGVNKGKDKFKLELPPTKEFLKIAGVVLVFSVLSENPYRLLKNKNVIRLDFFYYIGYTSYIVSCNIR